MSSANLTPVKKRLIEHSVEIMGESDAQELAFLHSVMAQCSLPYREPQTRDYIRENGNASLIVTAGYLADPDTRKPVLQGIPYGAKPRLLLIHLCTQAIKTKSPTIGVGDSMTAFMRELGLGVSGGKRGSIGRFKEQLNRLAASRLQLVMHSDDRASLINPAPIIQKYDVWFPSDERQKMLWPSEVTLSKEFFTALQGHALPLEPRAISALQHSARAMDCYTWLAHRLPRVKRKNGDRVSWAALQTQFGPDVSSTKNFKRHMLTALKQVHQVYKDARFEQVDGGLILHRSPPPIRKKLIGGYPQKAVN